MQQRLFGGEPTTAAIAQECRHGIGQRIDVHEDAECDALFPKAFSADVENPHDGRRDPAPVRLPAAREPKTMLSPEGLRAKFAPPSQGERGEAAFFDAIQRMDSAVAVAELYRAALPIEE